MKVMGRITYLNMQVSSLKNKYVHFFLAHFAGLKKVMHFQEG